jgi:hypothetical protein
MSGGDDWAPGDLALCVHDRTWCPGGFERAPDECSRVKSMLFPRVGSEWRVTGVQIHFREEEGCDLLYLKLAGQPSDVVFDARCFTKLREHEADAEDAETIALLTGKPVREPAA